MNDPLGRSVIEAWRTSCRATSMLVESLPAQLWNAPIPGVERKTVGTVAAHLHNTRSRWIRTLGQEHGVRPPAQVDRRATRTAVLAALRRSAAGIETILELGLAAGGRVPPSRGYVWRNLPLDVGHVLGYFVAHEAHHRGQLVLVARQTGHRLPASVVNGLWQWSAIVKERSRRPRSRRP